MAQALKGENESVGSSLFAGRLTSKMWVKIFDRRQVFVFGFFFVCFRRQFFNVTSRKA